MVEWLDLQMLHAGLQVCHRQRAIPPVGRDFRDPADRRLHLVQMGHVERPADMPKLDRDRRQGVPHIVGHAADQFGGAGIEALFDQPVAGFLKLGQRPLEFGAEDGDLIRAAVPGA